jgi:hypothetical protein
MKLTKEILIKLGFEKKGKIYTRWMLDLHEDDPGFFSFHEGRIYFDVETVEKLHQLWIMINAEKEMPLQISKIQ